jgi:sugar lactone lactonase YvrE
MVRIKLGIGCFLVLAVLAFAPGPTAAAPMSDFPEVIALPDGFQPEGVAMGRGTTIYAGSLATGAIYQASVRTGEGSVLVQGQPGRAALGLKFDARSGYLFVAGGPTGNAYVYDSHTGATVSIFHLASAPTFINDVVVTREAAYFTDSSRPMLYRLPLLPGGGLTGPIQQIALGGDFVFVPGAFNANGIEATPKGDVLLVDNTATGSLYRVDPATGEATVVVLSGGAATSGDGLLMIGHTLYVAQNFLNRMTVIRLDPGLTSGEVVQALTDADFDIPSTVTSFGESLYAVNARFTTTPTPDTDYWIAQLPRVPAKP